jgi:sugar lactone lactonase YvrE
LLESVVPDSDIELFLDARATIGESPLWCEEGALYWIDVKAPALYRTEIASRQTTSWQFSSDIGGYGLKPGGKGAFVALRIGLFELDFETKTLVKLCDAPFDADTHRFNESDCDPTGRLWLGTMFDPPPGAPARPTKGGLYSFTRDAGLREEDDSSLLHNGFAWAPDGREFFLAHSREGRIYAYEFDLERGAIGARRVFAEVPKVLGIPDGGAFDADGCYWSAIHRGGRLHRYAPDGRLDRVVELPVQNPTMMAFGGPNLRELYITSATHGEPGKPYEGGILRMLPGVAGLARPTLVR